MYRHLSHCSRVACSILLTLGAGCDSGGSTGNGGDGPSAPVNDSTDGNDGVVPPSGSGGAVPPPGGGGALPPLGDGGATDPPPGSFTITGRVFDYPLGDEGVVTLQPGEAVLQTAVLQLFDATPSDRPPEGQLLLSSEVVNVAAPVTGSAKVRISIGSGTLPTACDLATLLGEFDLTLSGDEVVVANESAPLSTVAMLTVLFANTVTVCLEVEADVGGVLQLDSFSLSFLPGTGGDGGDDDGDPPCPPDTPFLWSDGSCRDAPEPEDPLAGIDPNTPFFEIVREIVVATEEADAAKETFESLVDDGDPDPVQSLMESLGDDPEVANVELSIDGATVMVTLTNGITVGIVTDERDRDDWVITTNGAAAAKRTRPTPPQSAGDTKTVRGGSAREARSKTLNGDGSIICDETTFPQSSDACVILGYQGQFDPSNEQPPKITEPLERAGYTIKNLSMKTPQDLVRLQQQLPNCGVIYIQSHGKVRKNFEGTFGNNITTEIEIDLDDPLQIFDMMEVFGEDWERFVSLDSIGKGDQGIVAWSLTPEFFAQFDYPNSFVYMDTCHSDLATGGNQLSDAFFQKGAGAFVGWQGAIANGIAKRVSAGVFDALAPIEAVVGVDSVTITTDPADPGANESYVPIAQVAPIIADMQMKISVSGTDGFSRTETVATDVDGKAVFSAIPGGSGGVEDTITVIAGGADNSATLADVIQNDPELEKQVWSQPWSAQGYEVTTFSVKASDQFNLICNNQALTETTTIVKF